jgi:hypothetical protein
VHAVLLGEDEGDNALRQRGLRVVGVEQNERQSEREKERRRGGGEGRGVSGASVLVGRAKV